MTASASLTITVDKDAKEITASDRLSQFEQRTVSVVLSNADTWPAGDYTLALTHKGRAQAVCALSWSGGSISGTLNLNTEEIEELFDVLRKPSRITFDLSLWDDTAKTMWGRGRVDVYRAEWTESTASPIPETESYYDGVSAISSGASSVTVDISSYGLTAAPKVVATVQGPSGALNIFATVTAVTATQFVASLSANTDSSDYVLNWVVFP